MRIMNRCIVSLILIKCYVMLIDTLILLLMIEDDMCCLCNSVLVLKTCYLNCMNYCFFRKRVDGRKNYSMVSLLEES